MDRRLIILLSLLTVLLGGMAAWSWSYLAHERHSALEARQDLQRGRQMVQQIQELSKQPAVVREREQLQTETIALVESAARLSGLSDRSVRQYAHEKAARVGDTPYKEANTRVTLRNVTMHQLVRMIHKLMETTALQARSVRLSAPRQDEVGDQWNVDLVLSYLIYEPATAGER
jgi:acetolactate synthase small subunit